MNIYDETIAQIRRATTKLEMEIMPDDKFDVNHLPDLTVVESCISIITNGCNLLMDKMEGTL